MNGIDRDDLLGPARILRGCFGGVNALRDNKKPLLFWRERFFSLHAVDPLWYHYLYTFTRKI